jgi:hypothetical protein
MIAAGETKATEIGQPMNIAVVDAGGNLVAHVRMDGAWIGSIDISIKKAFTSRAFDIATKELAEHAQSGGQFFGILAGYRVDDLTRRIRVHGTITYYQPGSAVVLQDGSKSLWIYGAGVANLLKRASCLRAHKLTSLVRQRLDQALEIACGPHPLTQTWSRTILPLRSTIRANGHLPFNLTILMMLARSAYCLALAIVLNPP